MAAEADCRCLGVVAVPAPELGGSAAPDPVPSVTDTPVRLLEPTTGFGVPVVAWFRSGKAANHVESVYGHPADKVRRYPPPEAAGPRASLAAAEVSAEAGMASD